MMKFKVPVPSQFLQILCGLLVFISCFHGSASEEYPQQNLEQQNQNQQTSNNGYSTPPFAQHHYHRNPHHTRTSGGWGNPTESRTGIVPLFLPMIIFVGIVLLLFFAVVGSAAVVGGASGIGRHDVPTRYAFARDLSSSVGLARDVLNSEQCIERISCEVFRVAKGYKAQNWILSALEFLPAKSNLTKRASRTLWRQSKSSSSSSRSHRSGKQKQSNSCLDFQCSAVNTFIEAVKKLRTD